MDLDGPNESLLVRSLFVVVVDFEISLAMGLGVEYWKGWRVWEVVVVLCPPAAMVGVDLIAVNYYLIVAAIVVVGLPPPLVVPSSW